MEIIISGKKILKVKKIELSKKEEFEQRIYTNILHELKYLCDCGNITRENILVYNLSEQKKPILISKEEKEYLLNILEKNENETIKNILVQLYEKM